MKNLITVSLIVVLGLSVMTKSVYADAAFPDPTKKLIPTVTSVTARPTTTQDVEKAVTPTVTPVPERPIEPLVLGIAGGVVAVSVITSLFVLLKIRTKNGVR